MIDAQAIFKDLEAQVSTRQAKSLRILNDVLKSQQASGERNFSIAEIARLSIKQGGPSAQTIRNKTGLVFRQLIEAWAAQAGASMKAPPNPLVKGNRVAKDYEYLKKIPDPALRALFGQIIAERNQYRNELNILKANIELIVDRRPMQQFDRPTEYSASQPAQTLNLNVMEIEALKTAISDDFLGAHGWTATEFGQIKDENGRGIYKHGYVHAIRKILKEV